MILKNKTIRKSRRAHGENLSIVAVLENIRSLYNVGSVFRTADAAGVSKVYLCGITPAPVDRFGKIRRQFSKTALGSEQYLPWEKVTRAPILIRHLKKEGYRILALEQSERSIPYYCFRGHKAFSRVALVLGSEVRGLSPGVLRAADRILEIPMRGAVVRQAHHPRRVGRGKESLNVSVAFGIAVFGIKF